MDRLTVSLVAGWLSWRSTRWEKVSAEAAVRSAQEAARANLIAERALESGGSATTPDDSPAPHVAWSIEKRDGSRYVLRNVGSDVAEHVYVDDSQVPPLNRGLPNDSVIRPQQGVDMLLKGSWQHPLPNELYLRWAG